MTKKDMHRYDDMLYMEHHRSKKRAPMPIEDRAAQFAPFAALTGYGSAVEEMAGDHEKRAIKAGDDRETAPESI